MHPRARSARNRFTRRSSSEWNEIPANRPFGRRMSHASGQRAVQLAELIVHDDPDGLERALGRVAAAEARGRRDRGR